LELKEEEINYDSIRISKNMKVIMKKIEDQPPGGVILVRGAAGRRSASWRREPRSWWTP
jgi:hypothetical protein